jgi:hypothetical protein
MIAFGMRTAHEPLVQAFFQIPPTGESETDLAFLPESLLQFKRAGPGARHTITPTPTMPPARRNLLQPEPQKVGVLSTDQVLATEWFTL